MSEPLRDLTPKGDVKAGSAVGGGTGSGNPGSEHERPGHGAWTGMRSSNGTGFLKSNLFLFLLGQLVMFAFWLTGFAVTYGQNQQKFLDLTTRVSRTEAIQQRMDERGTDASRYGLRADADRFINVEARLIEAEKTIKKIDVMDSKIDRMAQDIQELKLRK